MHQSPDRDDVSPELIKVEGVSRSFSGVQALRNVSLSIARGRILGLVGENGSGKSTLIKILAGVLRPDCGSLHIDGQPVRHFSPIKAIRKGVQVIYQDFSLFPNFSVAENIALNSEIADGAWFVDRKRIQERASRAIRMLGIELDLNARVDELPVFQWQLVAIARALVQEARIIIMDEPTTALSRKEINALFAAIRLLKSSGIATVFVSHKLNEVCEIADSVAVLRNGSTVAKLQGKPFDPLSIAELMTGRPRGGRPVRRKSEDARSLLCVRNLSRKGAYLGITFDLHAGEVLGVTGLLGSGQTELALSLFGLLPANSGTIRVECKEAIIDSVQAAMDLGFAYVPEDRLREGLFAKHSALENLLVSSLDRWTGLFSFVHPRRLASIAERLMDQLAIKTNSIHFPVEFLSGGNQQRVVIARWLATDPRILILNNPTAGVDVASKSAIHKILANLAAEGRGIILISDDFPELLENCDSIRVMRRGRFVGDFKQGEIRETELSALLMEEAP